MKKSIILTICVLIANILTAQKDPDAIKALDKVAETMKTSPAWEISFKYTIFNKKDNSKHEQEGTIKLKGDKYILDLLGNIVYYDGKKNYNYLKEANEVNIMPPEDNTEELFFISPSNLFSFYNDGYKSKYSGEKLINGEKVLDIDLFPEDLNMEYFRINILINPANNLIKTIKVFNKNGITYEISLPKTKAIELKDEDFTFNPKNYPGVEVIDLTD